MAADPQGDSLARPTESEQRALRVLAQARDAHQGLLADSEVSRLQRQVDRYRERLEAHQVWSAQHRKAREGVESAGRPEDARSAMKTLWAVQKDAPEDPAGMARGAEDARRMLHEDSQRRSSVAHLLEAEREARLELAEALQRRVRSCISAGAQPVWFLVALGPTPPRASVAEAWLTAAVRLLWFRFSHNVTDELLPCGRTSALSEDAGVLAAQILSDCDRAKSPTGM